MSGHRFYVAPDQWPGEILRLDEAESHHCAQVLRLERGSKVTVFNGRGSEAFSEVAEVKKHEVILRVLHTNKTPPLRCAITLAQAIPKGKNMELIIQKATELGVSRIVPLLSERTVVQVDEEKGERKLEKWRQIALEAAKQCGQNWLPKVAEPVAPKQFFAEFDRYESPLIASLQNESRSFKSVLRTFRDAQGRRPQTAIILIGPEGDFTPAETALARSAGCIPVSLGPIVLRTETAAIYSLSVLAYELQGDEIC